MPLTSKLARKIRQLREEEITSEQARAMSLARSHYRGGRPRSRERCPCGAMTLKRATARGRTREHEAWCRFSAGAAPE
ncbi:MAG TPA: hypothetical protein VJ732_00150 [Bryobacteraceae bacterium]|nr:hypothetical protein [Bryobacteraceae bacterium]